jgi:hypothetical protein
MVQFQAVSYAAPIIKSDAGTAELGTVNTLWTREQEVKRNQRSAFGLELGYKQNWEYKLGFRTVLLGNYNFQANYDLERRPDDAQKLRYYADTAMSGQDYGLSFDVYPLHYGSDLWRLSLGAGLDLNQSRLLMEMQKVDETNGEKIVLAQYTSTIRTASLRLVSSTHLLLGNWDLGLGAYFIVPAQSIIEALITISDPQMTKNLASKDGETDIESSIAHDVAPFGVHLLFSIGYSL